MDVARQLIEGDVEISPEEMRLQAYLLKAQGNEAQIVSGLGCYLSPTDHKQPEVEAAPARKMQEQINKIRADMDGAVDYILRGRDEHPNRFDLMDPSRAASSSPNAARPSPFQAAAAGSQAAGGVFGPKSIVPPGSAFGQPSFGQPSSGSAFGQPSALSRPSPFGRPQQQPQGAVFGQPSQPFGGQAGAARPSPFGQVGGAVAAVAAQANPFGAQPQQQAAASPFGGNQSNAAAPAANPFGARANPPAFGQTGFGAPSGGAVSPFASAQNASNGRQQQQHSPFGAAGGSGQSANQHIFPNGVPTQPLSDDPPEETYAQSEQELKHAYQQLAQTGSFPDGIMPMVAPKFEWVDFNI
jgi:nucleoporin NUP42